MVQANHEARTVTRKFACGKAEESKWIRFGIVAFSFRLDISTYVCKIVHMKWMRLTMTMLFEWDEAKRQANLTKHLH